jgi:predicted SAM-dependent methyltransferase
MENLKNLIKKYMARIPKRFDPKYDRLHLGCGQRRYNTFLNVDLYDSDFNLDLSRGLLPFPNNHFELILSQHFIEHLWIESELMPLLKEIYRVIKPGGKIVLSTPDMQKITRAYINGNISNLIQARIKRFQKFSLHGYPDSHYLNILWHQGGEHKNLFDYNLLKFICEESGFVEISEISENDLVATYPEIIPRNDTEHTIIVQAIKPVRI